MAIKILNPVGFRLAPAATLRRCVVARRGQQVGGGGGGGASNSAAGSSSGSGVPPEGGGGSGGGCCPSSSSTSGSSPGSSSLSPGGTVAGAGCTNVGGAGVAGRPGKLGPEHVWWLVSPNTKQVLAAYMDPRYGSLVELPLPKVRVVCVSCVLKKGTHVVYIP